MMNAAQLSRIDLNLLVIFQVVMEEGHVGRAAARLNLTPSAVSHGLGRLRKLLGDPLFLRTPRGVVATARAEALRPHVAQVIGGAHAVLASLVAFDPATSTRRFILAAPDAVLATLSGPLLQRLSDVAPGIDIGLRHVMPAGRARTHGPLWGECLDGLGSREFDIAMLPAKALPARFHAQTLYSEDFVVAGRRGHRYSREPNVSRFCAAKHVLVSLSGEPRGFVDDLLQARGLKRRIAVTVPSFMVALHQVARSELIAILPRSLVEQYADQLGLFNCKLPFRRRADEINAITTKAAMADEGIRWLMSQLSELGQDERSDPSSRAPKRLRKRP